MESNERKKLNAILIKNYQDGDKTAAQKLLKNNENLVHFLINRLPYVSASNKDDFFQNGMMGLLYAIRKFDPSFNIDFHLFAISCIKSELLNNMKNYAFSEAFVHFPFKIG